MVYLKKSGSEIVAISCSVPSRKISIKSYYNVFDKNTVDRFINNTGIDFVHRTLPNQTASDLGYEAAKRLFEKFNIPIKEVGILLFASQSPDYRKPATACVLHKRLELDTACAAFDVNLGCSSFVYCDQIITSLLSTSESTYGLLILGETSSKLVSPNDASMAMMFGDAGAAILYRKIDRDTTTSLLMTDGNRYTSIIVPSGGFRDMSPQEEYYISPDGKTRSKFNSYMDGVGVFSFAVTDVVNSIKDYLNKTGNSINTYDFIVLHQANELILTRIIQKLRIPESKMLKSLKDYGNTSGVSIPLSIARHFGEQHQGIKRILAVGYGIGLSWGICDLVINTDNVLEIIETERIYDDGIIK